MWGTNPDPVALREDATGVSLENRTRKVQSVREGDEWRIRLNPDWLRQLGLDEQGAATLHSYSSGRNAVIVQHPAIIVQPAAVIQEEVGEDG